MEDKKEQTTLRLPAELKEQLMRESLKLGISVNALLLSILQEYQLE